LQVMASKSFRYFGYAGALLHTICGSVAVICPAFHAKHILRAGLILNSDQKIMLQSIGLMGISLGAFMGAVACSKPDKTLRKRASLAIALTSALNGIAVLTFLRPVLSKSGFIFLVTLNAAFTGIGAYIAFITKPAATYHRIS